jgi:hypothetical protein
MSHQDELKKRIGALLDGSLGLNIFGNISFTFGSKWFASFFNNAWSPGLRMSTIYVFLFIGLPWFLSLISPFEPNLSLVWLQVYGSLWSGWATTSTRLTSSVISKIIDKNIVPKLSDETAVKMNEELASGFDKSRLLWVSWAIGTGCAALAGYLIYHDLLGANHAAPIYEVIWWCLGWAILFTTAAKVVNVARFYRLFASHLRDDADKLYAMDPARSTLVISVASVARIVLLFWFGMAVSIVLLIPFGVRDWKGPLPSIRGELAAANSFGSQLVALFKLDLSQKLFVSLEVSIAGFLSIGVGTIVFLRSEAAIRRAVKSVTHSMLQGIEMRVASLSDQLNDLDEAGWKRLTALNLLHKELAGASSYRGLILSALSLLLPFVPLVSLFWKH